MNWLLRTTAYRPDGIFSELYQDATLFCVTLEHSYKEPGMDGKWLPKIARGATYTCKRGMHSLEHYNGGKEFETFEVTGVEGHSGLLFHPGNVNANSIGCVLPGRELRQDPAGWWITRSQDAFSTLMSALEGVDEFELEVA
jgi:hypothetical protein